MKNVFLFCLTLMTALFTAATPAAAKGAPGPMSKVTLAAGTLVVLETAEKINSDQATVGKTLMFRVRANVVVNGETVIATGAIAIGRVTAIEEGTFNHPGEMKIEVTSVQSVDGQMVALNGAEQSYHGKYNGEGVTVEVGQNILATVMNNTCIKI
jgi:hypothetical protein